MLTDIFSNYIRNQYYYYYYLDMTIDIVNTEMMLSCNDALFYIVFTTVNTLSGTYYSDNIIFALIILTVFRYITYKVYLGSRVKFSLQQTVARLNISFSIIFIKSSIT